MKKIMYDPSKMVYYEIEMDEIDKYFYEKLTPEEKTIQEIARALELQDKIENQHFKHKDTVEKYIPKKVMCNKCGFVFEVNKNEKFGYCPMCENDQVEINVKENKDVKN